MKYFLLIADGMADAPQAALGGKTPLAAAKTPDMDALAGAGTLGLVSTIPQGCVPGSDAGILTLLGYDPRLYLTGRSALEAAGLGIPLSAGQAACRCNFVTLRQGVLVSASAGELDAAATQALLSALLNDPAFSALSGELGLRLCPLSPYRLLWVGPSGLLDGAKTTPPHALLGKPVQGCLPQGSPALSRLMAQAHTVLASARENRLRQAAGVLPATDLWPWGPGGAMALPSFSQKYGVRGRMISATPLVLGIARLAGLPALCPPGADGTPRTDYSAKAQAAIEGFEEGAQLVCLHVEAPDACSHSRDLAGKLRAIEAIDRRILGPVWRYLSRRKEPFRILLTPDHRTLAATGGHDAAPVPWLLYDSAVNTGSRRPYTEAAAGSGPFIEDGTRLISHFLNPTK